MCAVAWTTVFTVFNHSMAHEEPLTFSFISLTWNTWRFSKGLKKIVWTSIEGGEERISETMIPPKLLVYRRTHSDANLETLPETWRRKKSCGELFQNGYRVRQGHHRQEERDRQPGPCHSVHSGLRVLLNWGKSVVISVQIYVLVMLMLKHFALF